MATSNRKFKKSSHIMAGIILATIAYPVYLIIVTISRIICNTDGNVSCSLSTGIGLYYLALLSSGLLALAGVIFIIYGVIKTFNNKK